MVFVKGMKATKGFTGHKHSEYSKWLMSQKKGMKYKTKPFKEHMLNEKCHTCGKKLKRIAPYMYRCDCWPKDLVLGHL